MAFWTLESGRVNWPRNAEAYGGPLGLVVVNEKERLRRRRMDCGLCFCSPTPRVCSWNRPRVVFTLMQLRERAASEFIV